MEGTNLSYMNPSLRRHKLHLTKALLMEGNTIHNFTTTKRALSKGNSFKCMIRGASLASLYTKLDILSFPLVAPIFPPLILKLSWQTVSLSLESFYWNVVNSLMLYSWSCKPSKISDSASLSLNLHHWIYDYFTFKYILLYCNYYYNY